MIRFGLIVAAACALPLAAFAQAPVTQQTTSIKGKDCRTAQKSKPKEEMPWVTLACKGPGGLVVRIHDVDLRQSVSVGKTLAAAAKEPTAESFFGPFNEAHDPIEWRMRGGKPFATIQRWSLSDSEDPGPDNNPKTKPILVVSRLAPNCHVAYIDAAANADANTLAQQTADEKAESFKCGKDQPAVIGKPGRGTELAAPQ